MGSSPDGLIAGGQGASPSGSRVPGSAGNSAREFAGGASVALSGPGGEANPDPRRSGPGLSNGGTSGSQADEGTSQSGQGSNGHMQARLSPTAALPGDSLPAAGGTGSGQAGQPGGTPAPGGGQAGTPSREGTASARTKSGGLGQGGTPADEQGSDEPRLRTFGDPLPAPKRPTRPPVLRPAGLSSNRDYVILIECKAKGVLIHPYGISLDLATLSPGKKGAEQLRQAVELMIARRQASVRPGEPPYLAQVRFLVRPDGLQALHRAYPVLEPLHIALTRTDLEQNEDIINIDTN